MDVRKLYPKHIIHDLFDESDREIPVGLAPDFVHINNIDMDPKIREIHIQGEIAEETGDGVITRMRYLEGKSLEPIRILLNTPGGSELSMFAIHDAIRSSNCTIEVLAYGEICSAGVLILACGDRRLVTESACLMSHESQGSEGEGIGFRASRDRQKFREWQHRTWAEHMGKYTPRDAAWWLRKTERQAEFWVLGGEAIVKEGLADEVVRTWPINVPASTPKRKTPFYTIKNEGETE